MPTEPTADQKIDHLWDRHPGRYVDVYRVGLGSDLHTLRMRLRRPHPRVGRWRNVRCHHRAMRGHIRWGRTYWGFWQAEPAEWATPVPWPRAPRGLTERSCRRRALRMYARALEAASRPIIPRAEVPAHHNPEKTETR